MKILIVDDDRSLAAALLPGLQQYWDTVEVSSADIAHGSTAVIAATPDLVLLGINVLERSGWETLRQMRSVTDTPIIVLSTGCAEMDTVKGLMLGADDYLVPPFGQRELVARIRAVLRRNAQRSRAADQAVFVSGDLEVNFDNREVTVGGKIVRLTSKEYSLLDQLVRNAGQILSIETLLRRIWDTESSDHPSYLKTYMSRLRLKLGDSSHHPRYIATERGIGYRFLRWDAAA